MKKVVLLLVGVIALAAIAAAIVHFARSSAPKASRVAECLPADTVAFVYLPDIARSRERWEKTALAQIGREPEVKAFLERPKSRMDEMAELQRRMDKIDRIDPR